jgi:DNA-binding winged helix-turn-helix (wHTH) protein/tetratricopeptide (TPR) repeat protein
MTMDGPSSDALITPASLASLPDFNIGEAAISPSRRIISGRSGQQDVEPRVMQVLVALAQANGAVVTRNALFDRCWGGTYVGDDSLNRTIAALRRVVATVAPGSFEIETIPRTGYRVAGANPDLPATSDAPTPGRGFPRRAVIGGAVAAAAVGSAGLLWADRRRNREFEALLAKGEQALDYGDPAADPSDDFRRAVAMRPDSARAQGLLGFSRAALAEYGPPSEAPAAVREAERPVQVALSIDPGAPDARIAQTLLQRSALDFAATEERYRQILAADPQNIRAMRELWDLLQCVGRSREALSVVERAIAIKPLAAANNYPRAQLLWILGRNAEADRVIDRAMQYWPSHRFVRFARFMIFAFTDRPRAALAMLDGKDTAPQSFSAEAVALWRVSLAAIEHRTPAAITAARSATLAAAKTNLRFASQAVFVLSALGEIDAAFEIVNELFVISGRKLSRDHADAKTGPVASTAWRFAPWLFIPPTASLRADARFEVLCDGIGLTDYWRKRGVVPDYKLGLA